MLTGKGVSKTAALVLVGEMCVVVGPQLLSPFEMCLTNELVPRDTPLTKAPGPRVSPSYGKRKKSATPFPILRTRLAGLPRISREPTTQPVKTKHTRTKYTYTE